MSHNDRGYNGSIEIDASRIVLQKMDEAWARRAQVRRPLLDESSLLDDTQPDYLEKLLPFCDHPDYQSVSEKMKQNILSCGWIAYNEKTVAIETKIISPSCIDMLYGHIPGVDDQVSRKIVSETLVDEAYHVLMVVNANSITRQQRGINLSNLPQFSLEKHMLEYQETFSEPWQKRLVGLACAIVSEIFISDYLDLLSGCDTIQPLNSMVIEAHRKDELAHGNIFKHLTKCIYAALSAKQRDFFVSVLPKPVKWFADAELTVWQSMLEQLGFNKAREIIHDSQKENEKRMSVIDYSGIVNLAGTLGILDCRMGRGAFQEAGLIH